MNDGGYRKEGIIIKKKILTMVAAFSVLLSLATVKPFAANIDTLKTQWDNIYNTALNNKYLRTENICYKNITFKNGYTYKDTKKDITSFSEWIMDKSRIRYYRTYSTY